MTDAILRDEAAPTHQSSPSKNLLARCKDVLAGIKTLCSRKEEFVGIPLDTKLPQISPELLGRIIQVNEFKERLVEGPSYKAKLIYDLDQDIKAVIGSEMLTEYDELKRLEAEGGDSHGQLLSNFKRATGYLKDELVKAFNHVKSGNKPLGWALNEVIHSKNSGPEIERQQLAVAFNLMEAHSTAGRCFNHWRNAGAEYIEAQSAAAVKAAERAPS